MEMIHCYFSSLFEICPTVRLMKNFLPSLSEDICKKWPELFLIENDHEAFISQTAKIRVLIKHLNL